jgi:ubiquinone/menaquinone biosynthesis C-methylase UbiE
MSLMESAEDKARAVFGKRSAFYSTSPTHTDPQVLQRVVYLAKPQAHWNALDIATGSGHTAFALSPHVSSVIAIDITEPMLAEAERLRREKALANVNFQIGDAHHLAFEDETFDLVTCRRAAHHFSDIRLAVSEMQRVLRGRGRLVIDDRSVPEDDFLDQCMNLLDTYHDESHVREYRPGEWRRMLDEVGFRVEMVEPYIQHRPLTSLTRDVSAENVKKIQDALNGLTLPQKEALHLVEQNGELYLNHWYVLISASRP